MPRNPSKEQNQKAEHRRVGHPESRLFEGDDKAQRELYRPVIFGFCTLKFTCKTPTKPYQLDAVLYYCARFLALLYSVLSSENTIHNVGNYTTDNVETWENYLKTVLPQKMRASDGKIDRVLGKFKYFTSYVVNGHNPRFGTDTSRAGLRKYHADFLLMRKHWNEKDEKREQKCD